ncbi:precorrin-3B C(17)-methyltransferase, partial [Candidatus Entotheonella palauensis]
MSTAGSLYVIGLGPGDPLMLTEQAKIALRQSQVVIGYQGYFTGVQDLVQDKECIALPLTQETQRAQVAADRALQGDAVCVISSGDAGIYGMASLVLEVLEQRTACASALPCPDVVVVPGISAVNACASLLGAPIAHDFAVISLSDLLTPWELI